jgi:hypothetical protein
VPACCRTAAARDGAGVVRERARCHDREVDASAVRATPSDPLHEPVVTSRFSARRLERPAPAGLELVIVRGGLGVAGAGGLALAG